MSDFWAVTTIVGFLVVVAALLTGGLGVAITEVTRGFDHRTCTAFGNEADREVRFVEFTYFSWDCLTPDSNGKWISIDRLRDVDN